MLWQYSRRVYPKLQRGCDILFSYRISSLIWASIYSSARRDTILRHRRRHDDHGSEAPVIQIRKKSGFMSHFQLSHLPKTYILNIFLMCDISARNG